jgi:hypothetical protein
MSTKTSRKALVVVPNNSLKIPPNGFRTETLREKKFIDYIDNNPGLTAAEYGDRLEVPAIEINDCILSTRLGRQLAERNKVRLPARGRQPDWVRYCHNKKHFARKVRENQFEVPVINGIDDGAVLGRGLALMSGARHLGLRSTPKGRKAAVQGIDGLANAAMIAHVELIQQNEALVQQITAQAVNAVLDNLKKLPSVRQTV